MRLTLPVRGFSPFPQALTALPGAVSVLLLTLLLMLCVIPVIATAQSPQDIPPGESPQKSTWRVISDAPYCVVPTYPPLKNFAESIPLGALEADACRALAIKPMQTMRLEYADAALVEQLLDATGQRANLMAIACHEILTQLRPDERVITEEHVHRSLHSEAIFNALKGWDAMTDDQEACQWDRLVVYGTIDKAPFDFAALAALLHQHGVTPIGSAIEHSLARLELGFVLGRDDQRRYFYRVPLFRELILQDSPQAKLKVEVDNWRLSQIKSKSPAESRD